MKILEKPVDSLIPYEFNNKIHTNNQIDRIANSIKEFWFTQPIVIDKNNVVIIWHWRLAGAKKLWMTKVPVVIMDELNETQIKKLRILDNKLNESERDIENLKIELESLPDLNIWDLSLDINDIFSDLSILDILNRFKNDWTHSWNLISKFWVPPFSILDTTKWWWMKRKRFWIWLWIQSELWRKDWLAYDVNLSAITNQSATSIFDPVLTEILYKWFNIDWWTIIDPFAWWSVRWIVAWKLKYPYFWNDLSKTQIEENRKQWINIINKDNWDIMPVWSIWDSQDIDKLIKWVEWDLLFSCPPYADLEVYSDDPKDISNMDYDDFLKAYENIIYKSCQKLKNDRFAVWVISEVRWKWWEYYWFINDTINAFKKAWLKYYNEMILRTPNWTAWITAARNFVNRKITRIHQNVLVFYKWDLKNIQSNFKDIDMWDFINDFTDED